MKFVELVQMTENEPVFATEQLLANLPSVSARKSCHQQLSRWAKSGKLIQARRGIYALGPAYTKVEHGLSRFLVANKLQKDSYVSMQSALAFYGMIPEAIFATVSVTQGRTAKYRTPFGLFMFRHMMAHLAGLGQQRLEVAPGQFAQIATPTKALFDLLYFNLPQANNEGYLRELRLQKLHLVDFNMLRLLAGQVWGVKLDKCISVLTKLAKEDAEEGWHPEDDMWAVAGVDPVGLGGSPFTKPVRPKAPTSPKGLVLSSAHQTHLGATAAKASIRQSQASVRERRHEQHEQVAKTTQHSRRAAKAAMNAAIRSNRHFPLPPMTVSRSTSTATSMATHAHTGASRDDSPE